MELFLESAGSIDMTPSEEGSTPNYNRWTDSIRNLLEDRDGVDLFKRYLAEEKVEVYLNFW